MPRRYPDVSAACGKLPGRAAHKIAVDIAASFRYERFRRTKLFSFGGIYFFLPACRAPLHTDFFIYCLLTALIYPDGANRNIAISGLANSRRGIDTVPIPRLT